MHCNLKREGHYVICPGCGWSWLTDIDPGSIKKTCGNPGVGTMCVLRGPEIRQVLCKPCQTGGQPSSVPVYRCPKHKECTLQNIGILPRIHACSTCEERLPTYPVMQLKAVPPEVLAQIRKQPFAPRSR